MKNRLFLGIALVALCAQSQAWAAPNAQAVTGDQTSEDAPRVSTELSDGWHFRKASEIQSASDVTSPSFNGSSWQTVSVPHTWNRIGVYEPAAHVPGSQGREIDKYMGPGWYRRTFTAPKLGQGHRLWIEFDAASRRAEVFVNGKHIGNHEGGFSRFRFDITNAVKSGQENTLSVKVDNSPPEPGSSTADTLPLLGDFFVQGGLYRPVRLIETSDAHFAMDDFGGPGVYAQSTSITPEEAQLSVRSELTNQRKSVLSGKVVTRLVAANGKVAAKGSVPVSIKPNAGAEVNQTLTVASPHLWQGTEDPYLYSLETELYDSSGRLLDRKTQSFGIRQFTIDPDKGFFINGKHVALHGVGLHQDSMKSGWAMSKGQIADYFATIRDMGANTIRLAHYQHGQPIHELADKYGFVLWDEIALVTAWTLDEAQGAAPPGIVAQARQQMKELIRQNYNHPSVAVWGVANEVDFGPMRPDFLGRGIKVNPSDPTPFIKDLAALAKQEDPARSATLATCCEDRDMPDVPIVADAVPVSAGNRYFGWYYGQPQDVGPHFDKLHAKRPNQPQGISEFGAGGALSIHTDNPLGGPHDMGGRNQPEEYEAWVHEQTWPELAKRPYIWGSWIWNAFDFATATRVEGDAQDINTKGLVSYDNSIRKDPFYYYRAHWSDEPTIHIKGRRYVQRAYPVTNVQVYSNAASTQLIVNGQSLGERTNCDNLICVWSNVRLAPGENHVQAAGTFNGAKTSDTLAWNLDRSRADAFFIDSGALVAAPGYGSDNFFNGGEAGSADQHPRGRPAILAPIAPKEQHDQLATFREGSFQYHIPVEPGQYRVTLRFIEPKAAPGERVFTVSANGQPKITKLDIAAVSGGAHQLLARSFNVSVTGKDGLALEFSPEKGKAIVSTIEISKK